MNVFGKYWIGQEYWCRDDVEMIHWLTTGANHATVDTCSEHLGSSMLSQRDFQIKGSRLCRDVIDNPSKLLKVELGLQLPMKTIFKLRRDMQKFARRNLLGSQHMSILDPYYWYFDGQLNRGQVCSGREILLANNKLSFFDECIVQGFHGVTVQPHNLSAAYVNFRDVYDLRTDDELNPITFQHSQMNLSRELVKKL